MTINTSLSPLVCQVAKQDAATLDQVTTLTCQFEALSETDRLDLNLLTALHRIPTHVQWLEQEEGQLAWAEAQPVEDRETWEGCNFAEFQANAARAKRDLAEALVEVAWLCADLACAGEHGTKSRELAAAGADTLETLRAYRDYGANV